MKTLILVLMSTLLGIILLFQQKEIPQYCLELIDNQAIAASNNNLQLVEKDPILQNRYTVTFSDLFFATCNNVSTLRTGLGERLYETEEFNYEMLRGTGNEKRYFITITDLVISESQLTNFIANAPNFNETIEIIDLTKLRSSESQFPAKNRWVFKDTKIESYKEVMSSSGEKLLQLKISFRSDTAESIITQG